MIGKRIQKYSKPLFDDLYVILVQKDLKLSLNMGDQLEQPLPLTASANEVSR
jgi:hypothetical protein